MTIHWFIHVYLFLGTGYAIHCRDMFQDVEDDWNWFPLYFCAIMWPILAPLELLTYVTGGRW